MQRASGVEQVLLCELTARWQVITLVIVVVPCSPQTLRSDNLGCCWDFKPCTLGASPQRIISTSTFAAVCTPDTSSDEVGALQVLTFCDVAVIVGVKGMRPIVYCPVVASIC